MKCGHVKADRDVAGSALRLCARATVLVPTSSCLKGDRVDLKQMLCFSKT